MDSDRAMTSIEMRTSRVVDIVRFQSWKLTGMPIKDFFD